MYLSIIEEADIIYDTSSDLFQKQSCGIEKSVCFLYKQNLGTCNDRTCFMVYDAV